MSSAGDCSDKLSTKSERIDVPISSAYPLQNIVNAQSTIKDSTNELLCFVLSYKEEEENRRNMKKSSLYQKVFLNILISPKASVA